MPTPEQPTGAPTAGDPLRRRRRRGRARHARRRRHHRDRRGRARPRGRRPPPEEGPRLRRRGSRSAGSSLVVGLAILAPVLPIDDPREIITEIARRGPFAEAGTAPGHLLGGDFNGRDMLSRLSGAVGRRWSSRPLAVVIGFVLGGTLGSARRLLPRQGRRRREPAARRVPRHPRGDPRARAGRRSCARNRATNGRRASTPRSRSSSPSASCRSRCSGASRARARSRGRSASSCSRRSAQGAKHRRIMFREVLPNVLPAMFSIALLGIAVAIVAEGTLGILGASVETDTPTWGNMIAIGRTHAATRARTSCSSPRS